MQMIPMYQGASSYRGRGRGNSSRGRGRGNILVQHGNKSLITMEAGNTSLTNKQHSDKPESSYSAVVQTFTTKEDEMLINSEERVILLLNKGDEKWEKDPWSLYKRYLGGLGYTQETYKHRLFYEEILKANGCTVQHFTNNANKETYKFSKILIGKILQITDWGISPFSEKSVIVKNVQMKYNYWDYIQAFNKAFLYENEYLSHTWFIKLMIENYDLPNWFIDWWSFYGTTPDILPKLFKDYFLQWQDLKPATQDDVPEELRFFLEFSIPWIWRATPVTGYTRRLFCLKYRSYSKFWDRMLEKDDKGEFLSAPTIKLLEGKISSYKELREQADKQQRHKEIDNTLNLWAQDSTDLQELTEEEIRVAYRKALMETLQRKKDADKASTSDVSMTSFHSQSSFGNLLQDSQDPYEDLALNSEDLI